MLWGVSTYLDLPTNIQVIGQVGIEIWKILAAYEGQEPILCDLAGHWHP